MNTRILMMAASAFMLCLGVAFQFFPHEVLSRLGVDASGPMPVIVQLAGALYIGFAVMDWMAKGVSIGGIYARPVSIGNFAHFLIGGLALLKSAVGSDSGLSTIVVILTAVYLAFAAAFGYVFMTNPRMKE